MNKRCRAELLEPAVVEALLAAERPLTLGEVSQALEWPHRTVLFVLVGLSRTGAVLRADGGRYRLSDQAVDQALNRAALTLQRLELLAIVEACERQWSLEIR